jgi:hypothetical protein
LLNEPTAWDVLFHSNQLQEDTQVMKKEIEVLLAIMFAAVILGGSATLSHADSQAHVGFLVPYAYYNDTTDTMIGIKTWFTTSSVYWSFMSQDGVQWAHGVIPATTAFKVPFSFKTQDSNSHPNMVGYLIFTYDEDGILETDEDSNAMLGNAVLLSANDAAFLPVIPLGRADYANVNVNLNDLNVNSIVHVSHGFPAAKTVTTNYWIDPLFNAETYLIIWCSQTPPEAFEAHLYSLNSFNGDDISFGRVHQVLNVYNVATQSIGLDSISVDGFVDLEPGGGERFMFTLIKSSAFSATQTMLGMYN